MTESKRFGWHFDNSYTRLPEPFYAETNPEAAPSPELVVFNHPLAESLGLDAESLQSDEGSRNPRRKPRFLKGQRRLRKHMPGISSAILRCLGMDGPCCLESK